MRPQQEVADVIRILGPRIDRLALNSWQLRTLNALKKCRTSALGGHLDSCNACGVVQISYNSCRNRHCPKCQGTQREHWIAARKTELLPVPYFHVVFTIPSELNSRCLYKPKEVYETLFQAAWDTLKQFGNTQELQMGMIAILHTWGQNLSLHPHLHCIVPGGGIARNSLWKPIRTDGKYLFSVKALSLVFRAKFVAILRAKNLGDHTLYDSLFHQKWVVYAKRPFGNVNSVIEYLGRYTHKIAISNHRIQKITTNEVVFTYKDYKQGGTKKEMTLSPEEFIRRFCLHILPKQFRKIRHFGFLSSSWKRKKDSKLKALQKTFKILVAIATKPPYERSCSCCKKGIMIRILNFDERGPPPDTLNETSKRSLRNYSSFPQ